MNHRFYRPSNFDRRSFHTARRERREDAAARMFRTVLIIVAAALFLTFLLVALLSGPAHAAAAAEPLIIATLPALPLLDNAQQITFLAALGVTDYLQTVDHVLGQPEQFHEINPLLGPHPTRARLAAFGAAGILATALISRVDHPLARFITDSIIATEQLNVMENELVIQRRSKRRDGLPLIIVASFKF